MRRKLRYVAGILAMAAAVSIPVQGALAAEKKEFKIAWSIYAGYMPWGYLSESGIMKKWADKYGIKVEIKQIGDYIESINQFTAGTFDGCAATTMDALSIPAVGGVDTTILMTTDYSDGNDGVILKGKTKLEDIKGQKVNLVELSVSHYFLARALETVGLSEKDITIVNTSDADMISAFKTPAVTAVVTWNPALAAIDAEPDANLVFDSKKTPGELVDVMMVSTAALKANPDFGTAVVGAWFEIVGIMLKNDEAGKTARESMAKASGTDLAGYDKQLATTKLFLTPAEAHAFVADPKMKTDFDGVRKFLFDKGLYGQNAKSIDDIGIAFADGLVLGSKDNIKLRFDAVYKKLAMDGKL